MGSCRGGEARGGEGWRDSGFAGAGVGFLCVRKDGPRGRHLQRWAHNADGPTLCEAEPAPSLLPTAGCSSFSRKRAWWGAQRDTQEPSPGGNSSATPRACSYRLRLGFRMRPDHCPCLPHPGLIVLFNQEEEKSGLTFFFSKPHCIG